MICLANVFLFKSQTFEKGKNNSCTTQVFDLKKWRNNVHADHVLCKISEVIELFSFTPAVVLCFFLYFGSILILDAFSGNLAKDVLKVGVLWPAFSVPLYLNFYISDTGAKSATVYKYKAISIFHAQTFCFSKYFLVSLWLPKSNGCHYLKLEICKRPSAYYSGKPT